MLKKNFIAANTIYVCINHTKGLVDNYISELDPLLKVIEECENGKDINDQNCKEVSTSEMGDLFLK